MQDEFSLSVSKRLDTGGYEYPSVRIRMAANEAATVAVRIVESLPPGVDVTAVGFHEDGGYEHWSVADGDRIVYENVVEAGETVSTVYAVADADSATMSACLDAPTVEVATRADLDAVESDEWTEIDDDRIEFSVAEDDTPNSDRQNSPAAGDWGDSSITIDEDTSNELGEPRDRTTEQGEGGDRTSERDGRTDSTDEDGEDSVLYRGGSAASNGERESTSPFTATGDSHAGATAEIDSPDEPTAGDAGSPERETADSVAERVAAELRKDEASEQAKATLRSHLAPDTSGSVEAKLDHCMSRIGELDAYVDALEAFLDEQGTAERLLAEIRDDLRSVEARVDDVDRRVESVERAQSRLDDRLGSVKSELDELSAELERVDELDGAVEELDESIRKTSVELTDAVEAVETDVSTLEDDLQSVQEWRSTVVDALSAAESDQSVDRVSD